MPRELHDNESIELEATITIDGGGHVVDERHRWRPAKPDDRIFDPMYVECSNCGHGHRFVCTPGDFKRVVVEHDALLLAFRVYAGYEELDTNNEDQKAAITKAIELAKRVDAINRS